MMLSHDLTNLAAFASLEALSDHDMTNETRKLLTLLADRLEVCAGRAASLEDKKSVGTVLVDLGDDKVTLFPKVKRPVPATAPEKVVFLGLDRARSDDGGDVA
ncbi:hypothetical protein [Roseibium sp.]|uniref:hypothetical protein n=1 Tax=Roseibium sp. TaxID=1936156 RepID=UPI003264CCDA